jgi:hypothetical protein
VPDGRPKKRLPREIDLGSLARAYTTGMVSRLGDYALNDTVKIDDELRLRAIGMLLDRGWGKPNQPTENKIEGEVNIILRDMMAERAKKK